MSVSFELQKAIHAALVADAGVTTLVSTRVFDEVPTNQDTFPYVTIGEDNLTQWDTDGLLGFQGSVTIHCWSRYTGRKEAKDIMHAVYGVLHNANLTVTGYNSIMLQQRDQTTFLDPDGKTRHGVQTFAVLIQPT